MGTFPSIRNWILTLLFVAGSGVAYGEMFFPESPMYIGAVFAVFTGMPLLAFERRMILPRLNHWMHRLPTPAFIASALIVDFALIATGFAIAGSLMKSAGLINGSWADVTLLQINVYLYAVAVTAIVIFIGRVRELLGRDVFLSLLTGRYRNPVQEERVFLFIDLVGSTAFAEEHGDLKAQEFLGSLFSAFAEPVRRHKGAIDDYIGDAAIITWPLARGVKDARCVRCVFDILADIEANAEKWLKSYGRVPRLRAALHGGNIVTAEIGVDHHKIAYFGDTVNTTARLESFCKTLERQVLISTDLARQLELPDGIVKEDLGDHAVRGRDQTLGVIALHMQRRVVPQAISGAQ
ncbi:adenylate/guanylate cyclase domain-containing protein [Agrobacterium rhizogenes]|uniref:adenylate/guanylate cyclase domain-containing protein n=1 Tax=Rhizobium rhizogenes TaxID=359 RepID=UPI00080F89BF|nr:adenylate/guanylate cyclase domain-containing protein [Rhizobium rhizogenes]OCJ31655.1 adenylate cyclase [Agrobacterium sp. B133/95]NTI48076.1 adenylate/guanylate cyclase domain-containing protein [Rhizobium rhizogenes]NTI93449.1 adenylate/guanylate cyclase domain-containing protein [Rhizobium rhizogenes]NTJ55916.1 adenylate/guanylate cyclase domain-containing protein [Rhizobium rhizogenes]QRM37096.1 adenylate/guanylate cyclase domain-containing protein [Rhizobium rhizogenes]